MVYYLFLFCYEHPLIKCYFISQVHCKKLMKMLHVVVFKCMFCVFSEFGNAWANENIFSVTEGIIWFRYHNYLASKLYKEHPSWSDEELFQNARKRVIATFQVKQIVLNY